MKKPCFVFGFFALGVFLGPAWCGPMDDVSKRDVERKRLEGLLDKMKRNEPGRQGARTGFRLPPDWAAKAERITAATPDGNKTIEITYYTNSIGMKLVFIAAGEFMMGCAANTVELNNTECPQHMVRITRPFYMGACPVSQKEYFDVMQVKTAATTPEAMSIITSWKDADVFCKRLSQKEGVKYRLPTEAEWEYACRAGSSMPFYTGKTMSQDQTQYPNSFGLYFMVGRVYQWCSDWYDGNYYAKSPIADPNGPETGTYRVVRGFQNNHLPVFRRSNYRPIGDLPSGLFPYHGFRVVAVQG